MAPDDEIIIDEHGVVLDDVVGIDGFVDPTAGGGFGDVAGLFVAIFVIVAVLGVAMSLRRASKLRDAGIDPLDPETDLQVRWAQNLDRGRPPVPAPAPASGTAPGKTVDERLADVDRLYAAGTITPSERDAARARILDSI